MAPKRQDKKEIFLYSKSSNSVHFGPKNSSRYSKPHYLNLYYDESQKSRYCEESH